MIQNFPLIKANQILRRTDSIPRTIAPNFPFPKRNNEGWSVGNRVIEKFAAEANRKNSFRTKKRFSLVPRGGIVNFLRNIMVTGALIAFAKFVAMDKRILD